MALAGGIVVTVMILAVVLAVVVSSPSDLSGTVPVLVGIASPTAAALFAAAGVQRIAGHVDTIRRQTNGMREAQCLVQREIDRADQVERNSRARAARVIAALDGAGVDLGDDGRRLRAELADELDEIQTRPIPTQQPTAGRHRNGGAQ